MSRRGPTLVLTIAGVRASLSAHAQRLGVQPSTAHARLKLGWPPERAVTTPPVRPAVQKPCGVRHPLAKLDDDAVREVRRRFQAGDTTTLLAAEHGVSAGTISACVRHRTWRHVREEGGDR